MPSTPAHFKKTARKERISLLLHGFIKKKTTTKCVNPLNDRNRHENIENPLPKGHFDQLEEGHGVWLPLLRGSSKGAHAEKSVRCHMSTSGEAVIEKNGGVSLHPYDLSGAPASRTERKWLWVTLQLCGIFHGGWS